MPFGIFSTPNTSTQSYCPARIAPRRELTARRRRSRSRPRRRRSACRCARARRAPCGPAATPPYAVPQNAALERGIARLGERGAHRVDAHVGDRASVEAAERVDADAGDLDAASRCLDAERSNAHVVTSVGKLVGDERIGWPNVELRRIGLGQPA